MKQAILIFFAVSPHLVFAQQELGPQTSDLFWLLLILLSPFIVLLLSYGYKRWKLRTITRGKKMSFGERIKLKKLKITIEKDTLFNPSTITLIIENCGEKDVDIAPPTMLFHNYLKKRKFRIRSINGKQIYPLFLAPGDVHRLKLSLDSFFGRDKRLKYYGYIRFKVEDVTGKKFRPVQTRVNRYLFF